MPEYKPPKDWDERKEYDKQWERERAKDDFADNNYKPPSSPGWLDSEETADKKWEERDAYDKQWERERAKDDYRK